MSSPSGIDWTDLTPFAGDSAATDDGLGTAETVLAMLPQITCHGGDIVSQYPGSLHFISGIYGFNDSQTVADNGQFRSIIRHHFVHRLCDPQFVERLQVKHKRKQASNTATVTGTSTTTSTTTTTTNPITYRVVPEIPAVLEKAEKAVLTDPTRQAVRIQDVRIWRKLHPRDILRQDTWRNMEFVDVTGDIKVLNYVLTQPFKTELERLLFPHPGQRRAAKKQDQLWQAKETKNNKMRSLNINQQATVQTICQQFNQPGSYAAIFVSSWNKNYSYMQLTQQHHHHQQQQQQNHYQQPNVYLAQQAAETWRTSSSPCSIKQRFIYTLDCTSAKLLDSLGQVERLVRQQHGSETVSQDNNSDNNRKRMRPDPRLMAQTFWDTFHSIVNPSYSECVFLLYNVGHVDVLFAQGILPNGWWNRYTAIRGILICTPHPISTNDVNRNNFLKESLGENISTYAVEWNDSSKKNNQNVVKPEQRAKSELLEPGRSTPQSQAYWWNKLPQTNLPYTWTGSSNNNSSTNVVLEPPGLHQQLELDGSAVTLVAAVTKKGLADIEHANQVANSFCRKWIAQQRGQRFALWLRARTDHELRQSYEDALGIVEGRGRGGGENIHGVGNTIDLPTQVWADTLMGRLQLKQKMAHPDRMHQFILVFADAIDKEDATFFGQKQFFSDKSNWFNSLGRFLITTTSRQAIYVQVARDNNDSNSQQEAELAPLPYIELPCHMPSSTGVSVHSTTPPTSGVPSGNPSSGKVALCIDIGSSSVRSSIYTLREEPGHIAAEIYAQGLSASISWDVVHPQTGKIRMEQTIDGRKVSIFDLIDQSIDIVLHKLQKYGSLQIASVGFSSLVMNLIGVDANGIPIGEDATCSYACNAPRVGHKVREIQSQLGDEGVRDLYQKTGTPIHPAYALPQLCSFYEQCSSLACRVDSWQTLSSLCLARWIERKGNNPWPISFSEASWTGLLNVKQCIFEPLALGFLPESCRKALPSLLDFDGFSHETFTMRKVYSDRWPLMQNAQFFLGIGDGACANVGSKCTTPDRIACTIGTSAAIRVVLPAAHMSTVPPGLFCYRINQKYFLLGGALTDGGSVVAWIRDLLNIQSDEEMENCMTEVEQLLLHDYGSEASQHQAPLIMLPFLSGERSTNFQIGATGALVGLSRATTRSHLIKSCFEGVTLRLAAIARLLPQGAEVWVSGKALEVNRVWRQMIADCTGRTVVLDLDTTEGSSRGVACLLAAASLADNVLLSEEASRVLKTFPRNEGRDYWTKLMRTQEAFIDTLRPWYAGSSSGQEDSILGRSTIPMDIETQNHDALSAGTPTDILGEGDFLQEHEDGGEDLTYTADDLELVLLYDDD